MSPVASPGSRKRNQSASSNPAPIHTATAEIPSPNLLQFVTVGFNSTQRQLDLQAKAGGRNSAHPTASETNVPAEKWLHSCFAFCGDRPGILLTHLPTSVKLASVVGSPVKLVALPSESANRIASVLGVARVSLLGLLKGASGASRLFALIERHVSDVEVPWLEDAASASHMDVNIRAVETTQAAGNPSGKKKTLAQGSKAEYDMMQVS